ncbi:MAG TPA: hypothetical protein VHS96_13430, partial [Bacteroidia bacterium]|nr:hypothetical protein [Bacteroidia bacterium]
IVQAAGNSNALLHYSMVDQLPFQGRSFYRVVETDQDGNTTATNVAEVNFGEVLEMVFVASPNPTTHDNIGMTIMGAAGEMIRLSLTDVHGHEIRSETVEITSDTFRHVFQGLPALTQGIYILHAHGNHAEGSAKILVK